MLKVVRGFLSARSYATRRLNRVPLEVSGPDSTAFLQGLITNDIEHLSQKPAIYALFLNNQGRILYDCVLFGGSRRDVVVLDVDADLAHRVEKHLNMFKVKRKVEIKSLAESHEIIAAFNRDGSEIDDSSIEDRSGAAVIGSVDPRVDKLGMRFVAPKTDAVFGSREDSDDYRALRYELGVPEGGEEIIPGKCFPLEYNADFMHGISFQKGCYIGQELTARTYHTGAVRKRILPFKVAGDVSTGGELIVVNEKGKNVGKVRGMQDRAGIALLRTEECAKAEKLTLKDTSDEVTYRIPSWWPKEAPKRVMK